MARSDADSRPTVAGIRLFALFFGVLFIATGIAGFAPGWVDPPPSVTDDGTVFAHGRLFGLFPTNAAHNILHIVFGVLGLAAVASAYLSWLYAAVVAVSYAALAMLGLFPMTRTLFGLVPLYAHDVWLHAGIAIVAAVFAWASPWRRDRSPPV